MLTLNQIHALRPVILCMGCGDQTQLTAEQVLGFASQWRLTGRRLHCDDKNDPVLRQIVDKLNGKEAPLSGNEASVLVYMSWNARDRLPPGMWNSFLVCAPEDSFVAGLRLLDYYNAKIEPIIFVPHGLERLVHQLAPHPVHAQALSCAMYSHTGHQFGDIVEFHAALISHFNEHPPDTAPKGYIMNELYELYKKIR